MIMDLSGYIIDTGVKASSDTDEGVPAPYYAKTLGETSHPTWRCAIRIGIFKRSDDHLEPQESDTLLGEYERCYSGIFPRFHPFELRGNWYALFSKDDEISLMELPSCQVIGIIEDDYDFRPFEFWVPPLCYRDYEKDEWVFPDRIHGFVSGRRLGDDSSAKVQYLDLSQADKGIIERRMRFGYVLLADALPLSQAIHLDPRSGRVTIASDLYYHVATGEKSLYE